MIEKREYRRIASDLRVRFVEPKVSKETLHYLEGVAENIGRHGLFVSTKRPCPIGSIVSIEFEEGEQTIPLRAKALVRWVNHWKAPRGMGLLIIEYEGVAEAEFARWLTVLYANEERAEQDST